jgi:hypothetical protein
LNNFIFLNSFKLHKDSDKTLHEKLYKNKQINNNSKHIYDKSQLNAKDLEVEITKLLRAKKTLEQLSKMNLNRTSTKHSKKHNDDTYFSDEYEIEVAKQRRNQLFELSFYEIKEDSEESEEEEKEKEKEKNAEDNSELNLAENTEINPKIFYTLNENPNKFNKHPKIFIRNCINGI